MNTLIVADYTALEVTILADLTLRLFGDDTLAKAVAPGAPDVHSTNVRKIFGEQLGRTIPKTWLVEGEQVECPYAGKKVHAIPAEEIKKHPYGAFLRSQVKTVFFGWAYGKRGYGFATLDDGNGGMIGEEAGDKLVAGLLKTLPALGRFESWVQRYVDANHGIYSLDGRWCDLSVEMSGELWMKRRAYRRALNFPCQATGAGIIGDAMIRLGRVLPSIGYKTILQVHDELVFEGPVERADQAEKLIIDGMVGATANGTRLLVPLQVTTGRGVTYYDAK